MRTFLALAAALAFALLPIARAAAHDQWGAPNWIANGHFVSPIDGSHCCSINDCVVLPPDEVSQIYGGPEPGYVWRRQTAAAGVQEFIPQREVQISRDGQYWRCKKPDGSRRCFFAPPPAI